MADIFQFRPSLYGVGIDLNAAWRKLFGKKPAGPEAIGARFVELFAAHGVSAEQIPRYVPDVGLHHLTSPLALLPALSSAVIERVCELFGVRREWLEGSDSRIYETNWSYKSPARFVEAFSGLRRPAGIAPVRAISTEKHLDCGSGKRQRIELVLVEHIAWLGENSVERFIPFSDGRDWADTEHRLELKSIIRLLQLTVPLYLCSANEMDLLYHGSIVPRMLMRGSLATEPSLEDYCMTKQENWQAKELSEIDSVISLESNLRAQISHGVPSR